MCFVIEFSNCILKGVIKIFFDYLEKNGIPVAVFHTTDFDGLFSVIQRLGVLTGETTGAERLVISMKTKLDSIRGRIQGITHCPSVFFEVRYPNLLGAGQKSIVNDIIRQAGGTNCLKAEKKLVRVNMEALIASDPEAYVVQRGPMNPNPGQVASRPNFQVLRPVRDKRILTVDEQIYSRPGPRSVLAVEELARFLHPDRFEDREL